MKEISYIESTGTQYIDTGVYGSNTIDVEISISPSVSFSGWAWLLGGMQSNVQRSYTLAIYSLNTTTVQRGTYVFHDDSYSFSIGQRYKLKLSGTQFTINDSVICNLSNQSFTTPVTMYLFANDNQDAGGVASAYIPIRLYYCKIWDNGTLIRDFVPAVENGHAGLYDRVNEQFYGNSGTGEFETPIWYVDSEGNLTNDYMPDVLPQMEQPYPYSVWRVKSGYLTNKLLPSLLPIDGGEAPEPVPQRPYICVYDVSTPQDGFEGNGLAVLQPVQCYVTEILNGEYSATLVHPIDAAGKWNYILERNLLKIGGQIFTIVRTDDEGINSQGSITADCEHIFYQLSDPWIFPGASITGTTGLDWLLHADASIWRNVKPGQTNYYYEYDSDLEIPEAVSQLKWNPTTEGMTFVDVVLGSNGIIGQCGGELYRDNFYFSLNETMEGAEDNAFDIHIGYDLTGIRRVFDTSNFCTYFRCYDQYGQWFAIAWSMPTVMRSYSHEIIRSQNFSYNINEDLLPEGMDIYEASMELLVADGTAYFYQNCAPVMSYTIDIKDVKNNPDFAEFSGKPKYKVGNTGRVYDERLGGYITLKITKTVTDALTGEVVQVVFGDLVGFGQPKPFTPSAIMGLEPVPQNGGTPLKDSEGETLYDDNGEILESKVII